MIVDIEKTMDNDEMAQSRKSKTKIKKTESTPMIRADTENYPDESSNGYLSHRTTEVGT